jgi:transcription initiation factor IIE alpha subunit
MLVQNALYLYKQKMLRILDQYSGVEAREGQLIQDAQINIHTDARPDDIRQALNALKDDGLASRRVDDVRGMVWKITPTGHLQAAKLALEDSAD